MLLFSDIAAVCQEKNNTVHPDLSLVIPSLKMGKTQQPLELSGLILDKGRHKLIQFDRILFSDPVFILGFPAPREQGCFVQKRH